MTAGWRKALALFTASEEARLNRPLAPLLNLEQTRQPRRLNLEELRRLLAKLGDPHKKVPAVHVAGTNGKGSVSLMLSHLLAASGLRVGLYTSPHLFSLRERIRLLPGKPLAWPEGAISARTLAALLGDVLQTARRFQLTLTYFDALTAAAFLFFAQKRLDLAVVEVGLGGRLDSTNVLSPKLCLITAIARDHELFLGRNLAQIAAEKGGIIKPGAPVYTVAQLPSAGRVLHQMARRAGAPLRVVQAVPPCARFRTRETLGQVLFTDEGGRTYPLPAAGRHQAENAALAAAAFRDLRGTPPEPALWRGLRLPARADLCGPFLFEGAHNPAAVGAAVETLSGYFGENRLNVVFGCLQDKKAAPMLRQLSAMAKRFYFPVLPPPFRPAQELLRHAPKGKVLPLPSCLDEALTGGLPLVVIGSFRLPALVARAAAERQG